MILDFTNFSYNALYESKIQVEIYVPRFAGGPVAQVCLTLAPFLLYLWCSQSLNGVGERNCVHQAYREEGRYSNEFS